MVNTDAEVILNMQVQRDTMMVTVSASVRDKHSTDSVALNEAFYELLKRSYITNYIRFGLAGSHALNVSSFWHTHRIQLALENRVPSWLDAASAAGALDSMER